MRTRVAAMAAAMALLIGLLPSAAATGSLTPRLTGSLMPRLADPAPCPDTPGFTCSTLTVPIDHDGRHPGTLDLAVAVADNPDAPRGDLLLLTGGPGQPGVSLVNRVKPYLHPDLLREYRLVMVDQRGTGRAAIDCPLLQKTIGGADFLSPPSDAVAECAREIGPLRNFLSSQHTVEDVDWLRRALGRARLAVNGVSYGTFTGAQYALRYPSRVSALVLDSVVPHRGFDPFGLDTMAATGRVLTDACHRLGCTTDPAADLAWVVRHTGVDRTALLEALAIMSVSRVNPSFEGIPEVLHAAREGDLEPLHRLLTAAAPDGTPAQALSAGLHIATLCTDLRFPWGDSATPVADRGPLIDAALARLRDTDTYPYDVRTAREILTIEGCRRWPTAKPLAQPPVQTILAPTLIVQGGHDLFTPQEWAEREAASARDARLIIRPAGGHGVQATDESVRAAVRDFLLARR